MCNSKLPKHLFSLFLSLDEGDHHFHAGGRGADGGWWLPQVWCLSQEAKLGQVKALALWASLCCCSLTSEALLWHPLETEGTHKDFGVLSFKTIVVLFRVWILTPPGSRAQDLSLPQAEHLYSGLFSMMLS